MPADRVVRWQPGLMRMLVPLAVHTVAAAGCIALLPTHAWAWLWLGLVLLSAGFDVAQQLQFSQAAHVAVLSETALCVDGHDVRPVRAWLGPGWNVVWLRTATGQRMRLSIFADELASADQAALRRHLRSWDFHRS